MKPYTATVEIDLGTVGKSASVTLAKLHGIGGKMAFVIACLCLLGIGGMKYAQNPKIQVLVMIFIGCLITFALVILFFYTVKHPDRVMLEGAELVAYEQLKSKNDNILPNSSHSAVAGKIIEASSEANSK